MLNFFSDNSWSNDEIKILLKKINELNKSKLNCQGHFENENLFDVKEVLLDAGYHRTIEEIQNKLTHLKISYLRCNLEDSSEKDIFDCPFYNELHEIYQIPISDVRHEFIQNLLSQSDLDLHLSKFSDHSYTNTKISDSINKNSSNEKVTVVMNKSLDTWFPVESIIGKQK